MLGFLPWKVVGGGLELACIPALSSNSTPEIP